MNNITVYALDNCNKCKYLIKSLSDLRIEYNIHSCEGESDLCDDLEELTNCTTYPIVSIENEKREVLYMNAKGMREKKVSLSSNKTLELYPNLEDIVKRIVEIKNK